MIVFNSEVFALGVAVGVLTLVLLLSMVVAIAYNESTLLCLALYLAVIVACLVLGQRLLFDAVWVQTFLLVLGPALVSSF